MVKIRATSQDMITDELIASMMDSLKTPSQAKGIWVDMARISGIMDRNSLVARVKEKVRPKVQEAIFQRFKESLGVRHQDALTDASSPILSLLLKNRLPYDMTLTDEHKQETTTAYQNFIREMWKGVPEMAEEVHVDNGWKQRYDENTAKHGPVAMTFLTLRLTTEMRPVEGSVQMLSYPYKDEHLLVLEGSGVNSPGAVSLSIHQMKVSDKWMTSGSPYAFKDIYTFPEGDTSDRAMFVNSDISVVTKSVDIRGQIAKRSTRHETLYIRSVGNEHFRSVTRAVPLNIFSPFDRAIPEDLVIEVTYFAFVHRGLGGQHFAAGEEE